MPYSTSFDGAAGTSIGAGDGWTLVTFTSNNLAELDGSGALRIEAAGGLTSTIHTRAEASADQFAEVVLGANFGIMSRLCFVRANSGTGDGWGINYNPGSSQVRLLDGNSTITSITSSACVAGDTLRIEASGADQIRVYRNGALIHTRTDTKNAASTRVGFRAYAGSAAPAYDDVIRSFESGLVVADVIGPDLTALDLTATSPTTLTGSFTSDEAGTVTAVLYLASQSPPSDAQVLAGTDENDVAAIDFIEDQAITVGSNDLLFTGASPSTEYKFKAVAKDGVPNTSAGVTFAGTETTPSLAISATLTLYEEDGTTEAASITGLQWAWWDDATPDLSLAADVAGTGASTDASGVFDVSLTGSGLTAGQTGTLLIYKTDGTAGSVATLAFCGPLVVSS